jgi:zinc protease
MFVYRDRLEQVTPESVQAVARKYLQQNNRTVGLFIPTREAQRISVPRAPELAEMIGDYKGRESVSAGEQFDVSPAGIEARTQRVTLPGGIKAALLPKKTRGESVRARLTLRYGNLESLRGKSAACDILPSLMMRGTKQLTRQQIQDEQDKNRARIQAGGGAGEATFTIETRREFLPNVVNLLRQVLREATLPPEELEILRTKKIADLEQQLTDPEGLATVAVLRQISPYERGDVRYVPTIPEDIQRWKALTHEEIALLYREYLSGAHGELAIVGDFDPAEIVPLVEEAVAGWTAPQKFARIPRIGDVDLRDQRQEILTPDKENAVYFAGTVLPMNDSDPDYAGLVMGNDVLGGGGLASRLANRVRQQEGLSYGVGSGVNAAPIDRRAVFYIHGISNPVNMPKLEVAVREELNKLLKDGVTSSELAAAQNGYLERQKVNRSDDGQLAQVLARNLEAGRDMSFYADLEKRITALTPEQVQQVLRKRIDPKRITLVVAGDFEKARREAPEK